MSALTDLAIHEAERITFETAVRICRDLANESRRTDDEKLGCLMCAEQIQAIADARMAKIAGFR